MPAHNQNFPWLSYYENYHFFEQRLQEHTQISRWQSLDTGVYEITLSSNKSLKIFICECYIYGVAEYTETMQNLEDIDIIVINSNWCGYTDEVKFFCRDRQIGIFNIRDFMAALNQPNYWLYLSESDRQKYLEQGRIS